MHIMGFKIFIFRAEIYEHETLHKDFVEGQTERRLHLSRYVDLYFLPPILYRVCVGLKVRVMLSHRVH